MAVCGLPGLLRAASAPPEITADENEYDAATQAVVFRGHARLLHEQFILEADQIRYFSREQRAEAQGNVRVTQVQFRLVGDSLTYWPETKRFSAGSYRLGSPPLFIEGRQFEGSPEEIHFDQAVVYFNEPDSTSPRIMAKKAILRPQESLTIEDGHFGIGRTSFFPVPDFRRPVKAPGYEFRGDVGYRSNLGAFFQTESRLPVGTGLALGPALDLYTNRGFVVGPLADWKTQSGDWSIWSELRSGYINDHGPKGIDRLGLKVPEDRYWIDLRHRLSHENGFFLTAKIDRWSDTEVLRDFRSDRFRSDPVPDSFFEVGQIWGRAFLTAFARLDIDERTMTQERLPEIRLEQTPTNLFGSALTFDGALSYARLRDHFYAPVTVAGRVDPIGLQETGWSHDRYDVLANLRYPIRPSGWLTLTPVAGTRLTHYRGLEAGLDPRTTRWMGQLGVDANLLSEGTWDLRNDLWGVTGLRHLLRPVVSYRWFPGGGDQAHRILPVDAVVYSSEAPVLDLAEVRHLDQLEDRHVLRVGLENILQTRAPDYGSRDLASFHLYQDINFHAPPGGDQLEALYPEIALTPASWLRFDWSSKIRPADGVQEAYRFGISLYDGDVWSLRARADYLADTVEQYTLGVYYRLARRWAVNTAVRWDARLSEVTEQRYSLIQQIGRSWEIEYRISLQSGSTREDDVRFSVSVALLTY